MEFIGTGLTEVLSWIGDVSSALFSEGGALKDLLPLFGIGIGVSAAMLGIKGVRSLIWGA